MRVLILSALLACAAAAPSGAIITPLASVLAPAVAIPAAIPTIPPGDLEAAAINAQVEAEDRARALADKERELAEQAAAATEDKTVEVVSEVKEKADDSVWTEEEKKWQALEALNVAQAKLQGAMAGYDGAIAANAPALAKSALAGTVLVPAPYIPTAVFAAPGIVAPVAKAAEPAKLETEEPKPETPAEVAAPLIETKSSLPEGEKTEAVAIEAEKPAGPKPAESEIKPVAIPFSSLLAAQPLALAAPWTLGLAPIALPYAASTTVINGQLVGGQVLAPTVLKTQW
ncbi:unnamed protein product [Plutella xylostella]|uniref:(diamondback moth) hypothetical protein n=1 Tax=Plutella xylostella TaxID=51655 RepID=A0A8S4GA77_PLUXY|nr:unnamed protein product [Plutella xylostella]